MFLVHRLKSFLKRGIPDRILFRCSPPLVGLYARAMTWYACGRHYDAPIDPLRLIEIEPRAVEMIVLSSGRSQFDYSNAVSEVVAGEWDKQVKPLEEYDLYCAFRAHFREGVPWEETALYRRVQQNMDAGKEKWGCKNMDDFQHRLEELDTLYENIKSNGYLLQSEVTEGAVPNPAYRDIHRYWPPELHEVLVNVDRDGNFLLQDGRHRLFIAQILELDRIPVRIKARHSQWQAVRDRVVTDSSTGDADHPDLNGGYRCTNSTN